MLAKKDLLLLGSLPYETAEENLRVFGSDLGGDLLGLPDGEVIDRRRWVAGLAWRIFANHPSIEIVQRPTSVEDGVEATRPPVGSTQNWKFRLRPGVTRPRWGDLGWRLGYAKDAVNSYAIFRGLRKEGIIPGDVRFQVAIPLTSSAVDWCFPPEDWDAVRAGYEEAVAAEVAKICEKIPHDDLLLQWDACIEFMDLEEVPDGASFDQKLSHHARPARLSAAIPNDVLLGYHICYGVLGKWPMVDPSKDLSRAVALANSLIAYSGRRTDYVHIPILPNKPDAYAAPLKDLQLQDAKLYLGVIHDMADEEKFVRLLATLRGFTPAFGIAAECGLGRYGSARARKVIEDHQKALALYQRFIAS